MASKLNSTKASRLHPASVDNTPCACSLATPHPNKRKRYETEKTTLSWASTAFRSKAKATEDAHPPGRASSMSWSFRNSRRVPYRSINAPAAVAAAIYTTARTPTSIAGVIRIAIEMRTLTIPMHRSQPKPSGSLLAALGRAIACLAVFCSSCSDMVRRLAWKTGNETAARAPFPALLSTNTSAVQVLDSRFLDKPTLRLPNGKPFMDDRRPGSFPQLGNAAFVVPYLAITSALVPQLHGDHSQPIQPHAIDQHA
ncbi:hypothetical protein LY76DRAFT_179148 [Colletotrichum caudatum]|nr:hypothetical protein LY76DRAFT_179148 [Colletotrichum caudatum]